MELYIVLFDSGCGRSGIHHIFTNEEDAKEHVERLEAAGLDAWIEFWYLYL